MFTLVKSRGGCSEVTWVVYNLPSHCCCCIKSNYFTTMSGFGLVNKRTHLRHRPSHAELKTQPRAPGSELVGRIRPALLPPGLGRGSRPGSKPPSVRWPAGLRPQACRVGPLEAAQDVHFCQKQIKVPAVGIEPSMEARKLECCQLSHAGQDVDVCFKICDKIYKKHT